MILHSFLFFLIYKLSSMVHLSLSIFSLSSHSNLFPLPRSIDSANSTMHSLAARGSLTTSSASFQQLPAEFSAHITRSFSLFKRNGWGSSLTRRVAGVDHDDGASKRWNFFYQSMVLDSFSWQVITRKWSGKLNNHEEIKLSSVRRFQNHACFRSKNSLREILFIYKLKISKLQPFNDLYCCRMWRNPQE